LGAGELEHVGIEDALEGVEDSESAEKDDVPEDVEKSIDLLELGSIGFL
jgi:hypothetical protein